MKNDKNDSPIDLRDRTLEFSKSVIRFVKPLKKDPLMKPIIIQLIRSSSSIGANFVEAKNAGSKKDFRNKVFISKKEAAETLYWLKLLEEFVSSSHLKMLQKECQELVLILQKIINTLRS
jgi:four helix bundle protein